MVLPAALSAAGIGAAQGASTLDSIMEVAKKLMLFLFIMVSLNYIFTTPNFVNAVADKIVGYPVCKGEILSAKFCFAPSEKEFNSVLRPVWNGISSIFSLDVL